MDCSLPGSPVHGIFQARVLEWVAISFSEHEHVSECESMCKHVFLSVNERCVCSYEQMCISLCEWVFCMYVVMLVLCVNLTGPLRAQTLGQA